MNTYNSTNPFRALDKTRFSKKRTRTEHHPPARCDAAPTDMADDSALFLAAVAGNISRYGKDAQETAAPEETFAALFDDSLRPAPETVPAPLPPVPSVAARPPATEEDAGIFAELMGDVVPLRTRGREVHSPVKPAPSPPPEALSFSSSSIAFSLEYSEEYIQGHVLDLAPDIMGKLRAGAFSHEGHVDLHGHNMEQAHARLTTFIRFAYQDGKRHLIIVTGRGRNSPGGTPVLRERIQAWLTRDPFKRVVLAFCTAKPGDGGAGALYLLLRKRKKGQGKIVWDKTPSEEELLL